MKQVYDDHFERSRTAPGALDAARHALGPRRIDEGPQDLHGYTRDAHTEIQAIFPRLPNPTLVLYVYPHLTRDGNPVPGYASAFPMYTGVEYALPGESETEQ